MKRKSAVFLAFLLAVPAIIFTGVNVAFATSRLCQDDLGRLYLPTRGFGCGTQEVLLQGISLFGNGTLKLVLDNPAKIAISIEKVTIINHGYEASSTVVSHPAQTATVNGTITTYPAYTETSYSWTDSNTSLDCKPGVSFESILANSVQTENCVVVGAEIHSGDTYEYVIVFSDGMPISGSAIAE